MKLSCYKYRVGKSRRGRELDSGVNRESLASGKPGEKTLLLLYFIFISLLFSITDSNTLRNISYSLIYCFIVIIIRYRYTQLETKQIQEDQLQPEYKNQMDEPISNWLKICTYYGNEGHNMGNCPYKQ